MGVAYNGSSWHWRWSRRGRPSSYLAAATILFLMTFSQYVVSIVGQSTCPYITINAYGATSKVIAGKHTKIAITLTNAGTTVANNVILSLELPPGVRFVSAATSPPLPIQTLTSGSSVIYRGIRLAAAKSLTVTYKVAIDSCVSGATPFDIVTFVLPPGSTQATCIASSSAIVNVKRSPAAICPPGSLNKAPAVKAPVQTARPTAAPTSVPTASPTPEPTEFPAYLCQADTQTRAVPLKSSPGSTKDRYSCYLACKADLECIFFFWEQKTKACKTYDYVADTLIPAPGVSYYAYEELTGCDVNSGRRRLKHTKAAATGTSRMAEAAKQMLGERAKRREYGRPKSVVMA